MDELYKDKKYIQTSLQVTEENIDDLERISVYNGDAMNEEINELHELFKKIKMGLSK